MPASSAASLMPTLRAEGKATASSSLCRDSSEITRSSDWLIRGILHDDFNIKHPIRPNHSQSLQELRAEAFLAAQHLAHHLRADAELSGKVGDESFTAPEF